MNKNFFKINFKSSRSSFVATFLSLVTYIAPVQGLAELTCESVFADPLILEDSADYSILEVRQDYFAALEIFFLKSREEKLILESEKIGALLSQNKRTMNEEKFKEYAQKSGTLYREEKGEFIIIPSEVGNALNKFVQSVTDLQTKGYGTNLQFVFSPRDASRFSGCYSGSKGKIFVSLNSVFSGRPTSVEVHEFLHFKNDIKTKRGSDQLFGFIFSPLTGSSLLSSSFSYSKGLFSDELKTYSSDLRLMRSDIKNSQKFGKKARRILFDSARDAIRILRENNLIILWSLSRDFDLLKENRRHLQLELKAFANDREYILATYVNGQASSLRIMDTELIQAYRKIQRDADGEIDFSDTNYLRIRDFYLSRAQELKGINDELLKIANILKEKSVKDDFLMSEEFFTLVDQYRELIREK